MNRNPIDRAIRASKPTPAFHAKLVALVDGTPGLPSSKSKCIAPAPTWKNGFTDPRPNGPVGTLNCNPPSYNHTFVFAAAPDSASGMSTRVFDRAYPTFP